MSKSFIDDHSITLNIPSCTSLGIHTYYTNLVTAATEEMVLHCNTLANFNGSLWACFDYNPCTFMSRDEWNSGNHLGNAIPPIESYK